MLSWISVSSFSDDMFSLYSYFIIFNLIFYQYGPKYTMKRIYFLFSIIFWLWHCKCYFPFWKKKCRLNVDVWHLIHLWATVACEREILLDKEKFYLIFVINFFSLFKGKCSDCSRISVKTWLAEYSSATVSQGTFVQLVL